MINDEGLRLESLAVESVDTLDQFYNIRRTIGRGEFAKVKLAQCRQSGHMVSVTVVLNLGGN